MVETDIYDYITKLNTELNGNEIQSGISGNEFNLIRLVQECRLIYDKTVPEFRDKEKVEETWSAIGKVFGLKGLEVSTKWRNMRDLYCRIKKRHNPQILANNSYLCQMTFLDPFIKQRRSKDGNPFNLEVQAQLDNYGPEEDNRLRDILTQFIKAVEVRPILYKKDSPHYKEKKDKLQAWQEISKETGTSVKACWLKWKNLRESYAKAKKLERDGALRRPFEFKQEMAFLDHYIIPRRPSIWKRNDIEKHSSTEKPYISPASKMFIPENVNEHHEITESIEDLDQEIKMLEFIDTDSSFVMSPNSEQCEEEIIINKFSPDSNFENSNSCLTEDSNTTSLITDNGQLDNSIKHITSTNTNTEDDLFAQSLAEEMKKIPSGKRKLKLKADMYKLLYEAMDDD